MGIIEAKDEKTFENFHQASPKICKAVCVDLWERESVSELKRITRITITNVAANLDPQMIRNAFTGMVHHVNKYYGKNGNTFPNE